MKKEIKERLYNEIKEIINNYDLHILEFNFDSTSKELKEIENKINTIIEIKHDNIHNIIESKQENKIELLKKIHEKYENDLNNLHNEKELLTLINKTYKKIIENGLFLILNEFINLIINNCKNTRDLNEFFKFFEYNREKQEYILKYHFYYDNNKYFVISYDIPSKSIYKKFYNDYFFIYYIDINNNYVWDTKYYNYEENKKRIFNYLEYTKKINNAFKYETIKKQCENLLKVFEEETHKQYKTILESNNKIDNANIYNLDGFKKYNVI